MDDNNFIRILRNDKHYMDDKDFMEIINIVWMIAIP